MANESSNVIALRHRSLFARTFRDKHGKIVIGQTPSRSLKVWLTAAVVERVLPSGRVKSGVAIIATGAKVVWSCEELFTGVNYFRRACGLYSLLTVASDLRKRGR